jgi:phage virion morphogenesis protein
MAGAHQLIDLQLDDRALRRELKRLLAHLVDPSAALRETGEVLVASTRQRFHTETDPDGQRWDGNADSTLLGYLRRRQGLSKRRTASGGRTLTSRGATALGAKRVLTDRGHLADSIAYQLLAGGQGVAVGTSRIYGATQQFGAERGAFGADRHARPIPWGDIPARPFLGLSAQDRADILAIWQAHLAA